MWWGWRRSRCRGLWNRIFLLLSHHQQPMGVLCDLKLLEQEPCGSGPRWLCYLQVCCFTLSLSPDLLSQRRSWWSKGDLGWPQAELQDVSDVLLCRHLQLLPLLHLDVAFSSRPLCPSQVITAPSLHSHSVWSYPTSRGEPMQALSIHWWVRHELLSEMWAASNALLQ